MGSKMITIRGVTTKVIIKELIIKKKKTNKIKGISGVHQLKHILSLTNYKDLPSIFSTAFFALAADRTACLFFFPLANWSAFIKVVPMRTYIIVIIIIGTTKKAKVEN